MNTQVNTNVEFPIYVASRAPGGGGGRDIAAVYCPLEPPALIILELNTSSNAI
jgi:hypothetical protein